MGKIYDKEPIPCTENWKMYAEYEDGTEWYITGNSEEDCMYEITVTLSLAHGDCTYYTGVCDEDYEAGEYIGRDNFIYD